MGVPNWVVVAGIITLIALALALAVHHAFSPPLQPGDDGASTSKNFQHDPLPQFDFTAHYNCKTPTISPTFSNLHDADLKHFTPEFQETHTDCAPTKGQPPPAGEKCTQLVWQVSATYEDYNALKNRTVPARIMTDLGEITCPCECVKPPANCDGEGRHSAGNCVDPNSLH
jgi:hypothetical protein